MNLVNTKKSLSECHIPAGPMFDFYKDVNKEYLLDRASEELNNLYYENNLQRRVEAAKKIIQLLTIYRVKTNETIQAESKCTSGT
jgi:hypothetical protein